MTTWNKNQTTAALRRCVLNVSSLIDGAWAPVATSLTGLIFVRLGGVAWTPATGTATNTGYDGHWIYEATQAETNVVANEVEIRVVDPTWYAQTLVSINQSDALGVNVTQWNGVAPNDLVDGRVDAYVGRVDAAAIVQVANGILDALLQDHSVVGSVADGIAVAAGLLQGNFMMDNVNNSNPNGQTFSRMRVWRSAAAMAAASVDGGGLQGAFASFDCVTTYSGPNKVTMHKTVRTA